MRRKIRRTEDRSNLHPDNPRASIRPHIDPPPTGPLRALIVDERPEIRREWTRQLEHCFDDATIIEASHLAEAMEKMHAVPCNVVLMVPPGASPNPARSFAAELEEAREQERAALAQRVHDRLGQTLTALDWDLARLHDKLSVLSAAAFQDIHEKLDDISNLVGDLVHDVRTIGSELSPRMLEHFGLLAAIEWQARAFESRYHIRCNVATTGEALSVDRDRARAVFRIFQEILTNVARHAKATRVRIDAEVSPGEIALAVEDNGCGLGCPANSTSLGIPSMHERAGHYGGRIDISSAPKKGTLVAVRIPNPERTPGTDLAGTPVGTEQNLQD